MPPDERNKLHRLEELKSKLFSKNYKTRLEHRDVFSHLYKNEDLDSWETKRKVESNTKEKFFMKTSRFKNFFIFSAVFFVLTLGYAFFVFFAGGNTVSNDNIDISILGNNFTAGGEELALIIGIANRNNSALDLADLIMEYPKGGAADLFSDTEHFRTSLGTIPAGAVRNENLKVTLFGEQGSVRPIKITLEYRVAGSNAIFVKEKSYEVSITSTPINLSVDTPLSISPNQDITLNIKAALNATKVASKILVKVDYPFGFTFFKAEPAPSFGNNVWNLGDIAPGAEHNIVVTGKFIDVFDGEEKTFNVSSGPQSDADKSIIGILFNSKKNIVAIKKPFVDVSLSVNGEHHREYAADAKTLITAKINYMNNLDTKIDDLQIRAKISGNAVDRNTISAQQGFYDSSNNTIIWDKNYQSGLKEVNSGDSGSVLFSVSPLSLFSALGGILTNPSINIEVSISGRQIVEGSALNEISNLTSAVVHIISDVGFSGKALYYSGPFTNTGPIPPKVEQTTTYTVVWALSNTANNISKAQIKATIFPWVNFVGSISPIGEDLKYNAFTKEITWNVDRISKGSGITGSARSVAFQISFKPSLSQVGTTPFLINDAILTGHDDFANVDVTVRKSKLDTNLENDSVSTSGGGVVVK